MRPRVRVAALLCLAATVASGTTLLQPAASGTAVRPARVAVDESYPRPASGAWTFRGHGYGHGRGMSQHGAQGAALDGLSHERILAFYYPGTTLGRSASTIRVLVSADTTPDLVVVHTDGLKLRDRGARATYRLPTDVDAERWRITVDAQGRDVVSYLAGGTWRPWRPGGAAALTGPGEFGGAGPVQLVSPSGVRRYRGWLRAAAPRPGSTDRDTVNVLPMDSYLRGVVPAEMPASWEPEAVQAQAVAARTYASWHRARNESRHYQVCDTTACQVYAGVSGEHPLGDAAVAATARQILLHDGRPAFTEFSASSGGFTVAGDAPYLTAKADPYDDWPGNSVHDWSARVTAAAVQRAWPSIGTVRRIRITARTGHGEWRGRVHTMVLVGSRGSITVTGDQFRFALGLRSTWFRP